MQSIVDQKTDFDFDIVVGDDLSTDETPEILREFADRYPKQFTLILNTSKIGGTVNYVTTHQRATGEYIAHIDGDDIAYPGKLQNQVNLLDLRQDIALVWHSMDIFSDDGSKLSQTHVHLNEVVDTQNILLQDILRFGTLGAASSAMYRRSLASHLSEIHCDTLDFYFAARILEQGKGARIDAVLGGYRFNPVAVTLSKRKSPYFRASPMRELYASHLHALYDRNKNFKAEIFLNSVFNFCVEMRFLRPTMMAFLRIAMRTFSVVATQDIPAYFSKAFRLRAK